MEKEKNIKMKTPTGIELKTGQIWQEVDPRFTRLVEITGLDADTQRVQLNGRSWAKLKRFNGKSHGYKLVEVA
jgi:hypothetical protein